VGSDTEVAATPTRRIGETATNKVSRIFFTKLAGSIVGMLGIAVGLLSPRL
jgi:hypothetical protein